MRLAYVVVSIDGDLSFFLYVAVMSEGILSTLSTLAWLFLLGVAKLGWMVVFVYGRLSPQVGCLQVLRCLRRLQSGGIACIAVCTGALSHYF